MGKKGVNRLFLGVIAFHIALVIVMILCPGLFKIGVIANLLLGELVILIPGLIYLLIYVCSKRPEKEPLKDRLMFHKIKPSTFFMSILFTFLMMPLTTLINAISMLFVDNTMLALSDRIIELPFAVMFFIMAIFGPFCEEFVFRGIIYGGYRKEGRGLAAVLFSGLLFGLMHMNLNQACYAFVIGIALALLAEASGSIWTSILFHGIFNAQSVCIMYLVEKMMPGYYSAASQAALTKEDMYLTISVYLVLAVAATAAALCVLVWIAGNEGRKELLKEAIFGKKAEKKTLLTPILIIAIILSIAYIIFDLVGSSILG